MAGAIRRGARGDGRVDGRGQAAQLRGYSGRVREHSEDVHANFRRGQYRQADVEDRRSARDRLQAPPAAARRPGIERRDREGSESNER